MFKNILLPIDGSPCSDEAIAKGLEFARDQNAEICFVYVLENPVVEVYGKAYGVQLKNDLRHMGEETLERAKKRAEAAAVPVHILLIEDKHPVEAILDIEKDYDLTVMATRGRRNFDRMVLGSVTEAVLRRSDKPHLVVRCSQED